MPNNIKANMSKLRIPIKYQRTYLMLIYIIFKVNIKYLLYMPKDIVDTQVKFSIKTLASFITAISVFVGIYYTLKMEIKEAKELPKPEVSKIEFDLKDQMIRQTILSTQEDVKEIKDTLKNIETRLKSQ